MSLSLTEGWNKIWKSTPYGGAIKRLTRTEEKLKNLREGGLEFFPGQKVLDTGCGDGTTLLELVKSEGIIPSGVDISHAAWLKAVQKMQKAGIEADIKRGDVRKLLFPNNQFDLILSWGVIEHFLDYELAIKEAHRTLKPGGILNLVQPHKYSLRHLKMLSLKIRGRWDFGLQINFSGPFLKKVLLRNGFSRVRYFVRPYIGSSDLINNLDTFFYRLTGISGYYLYVIAKKY